MIYLIYTLVFVALALGLNALLSTKLVKLPKSEDEADERGDELTERFSKSHLRNISPEGAKEESHNPILRIFALLGGFNSIIFPASFKSIITKRLMSAKVGLIFDEFMFMKEILAGLALLIYFGIFAKPEPLYISLVGVTAFFVLDIWVNRKIAAYRTATVKLLPDAVDLLSLAVGAGLDFMLAMKWVVEKSENNPLMQEFALLMHEINVGRSRKEALKSMAARIDVPEAYSFARTLIQADRMGTSVAEALDILSEEMRMRRFQRGERIALQAPIKLLFPLIFCILPVVMIIVGGPVLLQFMQSGIKL